MQLARVFALPSNPGLLDYSYEERQGKRALRRRILAQHVCLAMCVGVCLGLSVHLTSEKGLADLISTAVQGRTCAGRYVARTQVLNTGITHKWCQDKCTQDDTSPCLGNGDLSALCTCVTAFNPPRLDLEDSTCRGGRRVCADNQLHAAWSGTNVTNTWCRDVCERASDECTCDRCKCVDRCPEGTQPIVMVDFDGHEPNMVYSVAAAAKDFGVAVTPSGNFSAATTVKDPKGGTSMQITYAQGCIGSPCGPRFKTPLKFGPVDEAYLSFRVKFLPGFDWVKGGKLPATLCGGLCPTKNGKPTGMDGWASTVSWRPGALPISYVYHANQSHPSLGDNLAFDSLFQVGRMHHVVVRVKMNTPGRLDGVIEAWLDGRPAANHSHLLFRNRSDLGIDTFMFSSFFGGLSPPWAPPRTMAAVFDDVTVCAPVQGHVRPA